MTDQQTDTPKTPQFVNCVFKPGAPGGYCYVNNGDPVAVGDEVYVEGKGGDGKKRVYVTAILDEAPPMRPGVVMRDIIGIAPPREEPAHAVAAPEHA
jgi:hypothetical protein